MASYSSSSSKNDSDNEENNEKKEEKKNIQNTIFGIVVVAAAVLLSLYKRRSRRREEDDLLTAFFPDIHPPYTPSITQQLHKGFTYSRHEIEDGDTLWGISTKYEVSVESLKDVNGIKDDDIYVGDTLVIPIKPCPQAMG